MFTGIVEELGTLENISGGANFSKLLIKASKVLEGVNLGDSIAVNGVCLTVTSFTAASFTADVMPETMKKTSLGQLKRGDTVNLERALRLGDRLGGHIVSGHVDGVGEIVSREPHANAVLFRIKADPSLLAYMVPRGSVAIDGISLTLIDVTETDFAVSIIPHTISHTNLRDKRAGEIVNLECDMIAKYVERLMTASSLKHTAHPKKELNEEFLRENGFL